MPGKGSIKGFMRRRSSGTAMCIISYLLPLIQDKGRRFRTGMPNIQGLSKGGVFAPPFKSYIHRIILKTSIADCGQEFLSLLLHFGIYLVRACCSHLLEGCKLCGEAPESGRDHSGCPGITTQLQRAGNIMSDARKSARQIGGSPVSCHIGMCFV